MDDLTAVRNELECPICMEYMVQEIYLCVNGHSICKECLGKVRPVCPICRGQLANRRNLTLEKIASSIKYPCKICNEELEANNMVSHELSCDSGTFACNIFLPNCMWKGQYSELNAHIKEKHESLIETWQPVSVYQVYILFYKELPFIVFYRDFGEVSHYSCIFIGPKTSANKYKLNVKFTDHANLGFDLSGSCPCVGICRFSQVIQSHRIMFATQMMHDHFLRNDDFYASTITISE